MNELVIALTLFFNTPDMAVVDGVQPRSFVEFRTCDSKVECEITARAMKIHVPGGRLVCRPRERSPDEKLTLARALP